MRVRRSFASQFPQPVRRDRCLQGHRGPKSGAGIGADHSPVTAVPFWTSSACPSPENSLPSNVPDHLPVSVTYSCTWLSSGAVGAARTGQQRKTDDDR